MILFESATKILPKVSAYAVHALQFPVPMAGGTAVCRGTWRGIYIVYEYYIGALVGISYLVSGVLMLLWFVGGRFISLPLLGRPGADEPKPTRTGMVQRVERPDGTILQVEFYGPEDGQPIILSHGWGPNSMVWYYAKRQLSDRFRVIVWDLPGLGKSTRPKNSDYSLEKFARDLEAVIALAGNKPVILL